MTNQNDTVEEWEKRFEEESPLAFDGRKWAKDFIRSTLTEERKRLEVYLCAPLKHDEFCVAKGKQYKECAKCYLERKFADLLQTLQ